MEVIIYNKKGRKLLVTPNAKEASLLTNIPKYIIKECLKYKRNYAGNYQFRYRHLEKLI